MSMFLGICQLIYILTYNNLNPLLDSLYLLLSVTSTVYANAERARCYIIKYFRDGMKCILFIDRSDRIPMPLPTSLVTESTKTNYRLKSVLIYLTCTSWLEKFFNV